jgi:hypothetical protein
MTPSFVYVSRSTNSTSFLVGSSGDASDFHLG